MPRRKRTSLGRKTHGATADKKRRLEETDEARAARLEDKRIRSSQSRAHETDEARDARLQDKRMKSSQSRSQESEEAREARLNEDRERHSQSRSQETDEERARRLEDKRIRSSQSRSQETEDVRRERLETDNARHQSRSLQKKVEWHKAAFHYDCDTDYASHKQVDIGRMEKTCTKCNAKKWKNESPGLCCSDGKVDLPKIQEPPNALKDLLLGDSSDARHFRNNIWKYNAAFQMTSFGAERDLTDRGYFTTFKVK